MPGSAGKGPFLHPLPALPPPPAAAPMPGKPRQEEEEGRGWAGCSGKSPASPTPEVRLSHRDWGVGWGGWGGLARIPTLIPLTPDEPQEMTRAVDKSSPGHINTQENPQAVPKPPGTSGTSRQPFPGGLSSGWRRWGGVEFSQPRWESFSMGGMLGKRVCQHRGPRHAGRGSGSCAGVSKAGVNGNAAAIK